LLSLGLKEPHQILPISGPTQIGSVRRPAPLKGNAIAPGGYSDPDARWKTKSKDYVFFGYKVHLIVDAKPQLPLDVKITSGSEDKFSLDGLCL